LSSQCLCSDIIEETGKNAKGLKVGDRVSVDICMPCRTYYFCRRGDGLLCETFTQLGIHTDGAFAEYVKAPWKNCYPIPDKMK
jgi:threonine dehydrogenase-like Zn-dependent dehydrogenase